MCVAVIFIVQNAAVVEIKFLAWSLSISRALLMFLLLAFGVIIGWLMHSVTTLKKKKQQNPNPAQ